MPQIAWQPSFLAWMVLIGVVLASLHAVSSYTRAKHVLAGSWMRALIVLRLLALSAVAVAAFQPTLWIKLASPRTPRVIVMMDSSRSMGVTDPNRTTGDLVRFAEAVGQIAPVKRDEPTAELLTRLGELLPHLNELKKTRTDTAQSKTAGQLDAQSGQRESEQLARLRASVASIGEFAKQNPSIGFAEPRVQQIAGSLDPGKIDGVRGMIDHLSSDLRKRQDSADEQLIKSDPAVAGAVEKLRQQSRIQLAKLGAARVFRDVQGKSQPVLQQMSDTLRPEALVDLAAEVSQTPILSSIRQTIERVGPRDVQAIVLLTDGRSTEPRTAIPPLLSAAGVPVFPVLCAPVDRLPDVRVVALDVPPTALVGESISATVRVRSRGAEGKVTKVTLTDGVTTQTRSITLSPDADLIQFDIPAGQPPTMKLKATVEPLQGEALVENNSISNEVTVVDQKIKVMLIAASHGWDVQYLRNILSRTPWVQLEEQSLRGTEMCRFSVEQILEQDVIVLAGAKPGSLSAQQIDAIHRAASEQSRSVLLMGVDPDLLNAYARLPQLAAFLPYRLDQSPTWRSAPADEPTLRPVPTAIAATLPLLKLDDAPDASVRKWLARPQMFRVLETGQLKPQAAALLVDRATQSPLLIESVVGSGRSMLLSIDETWRWRRDEGGNVHDRFWLQLIRHLCEPRYNVVRGGLSLGVDRTRAVAGQTIDVRSRVPLEPRTAPLVILKQGDRVIETQSAQPLLAGSGRWNVRLTPQTPGAYDIVLRHGEAEAAIRIQIDPADEAELADVSPDPVLLRQIASATGGRMFMLHEIDQVAGAIASPQTERADIIEYAVWCSPYLFGFLVACLGLEWALRKQIGLV